MSYTNMSHNFISFYVTSGEERTIYLGMGIDTATERYLNLSPGQTSKLRILSSVSCLITEIDSKKLKYPIKVHTVKQLNILRYQSNINNFKIHALAISTIDIYGGF